MLLLLLLLLTVDAKVLEMDPLCCYREKYTKLSSTSLKRTPDVVWKLGLTWVTSGDVTGNMSILLDKHNINIALLCTCCNGPPAAALFSLHQTLSWPPPEPLQEEHFLACQQLHLSVQLLGLGASSPPHPGS